MIYWKIVNRTFLIGIHGKAHTGKDTVAKHLIEKYNLLRYGPSVPVKNTTAAMFDIPREWLDDEKMKEHYVEFWGMTVRQMAQKVGKESSRDVFGNDIWMRHVEKKLIDIKHNPYSIKELNVFQPKRYNGIVLADIRYESEVKWIKNNGGDVIFVRRDNTSPINGYEGHDGEKGLPDDLADILLYNNGTIEELYKSLNDQLAFYYSWVD